MHSVVPVKTAISAALTAASWPTSAPTVRWSEPTESEDWANVREMVYFAAVRDLAEEYNTIGHTCVDESYTLRIHIDVIYEGDGEKDAETRAWDLFSTVRGVLHANHNLISTPGSLAVRLGGRTTSQSNGPIPNAWVIRIQVDQLVDTEVYSI